MFYNVLSTLLALGFAASAFGVLTNVRFSTDAMVKPSSGWWL